MKTHRDDDRNEMKDGDSERGERSFARRRPRPSPDLVFDYKDPETLKQFISETGKIVPARVSRLSSKQQRELTTQVKRARQLAILPVATSHNF